MQTQALSSCPHTTKRDYVDGDGSSGRRFREQLQTDLQTTGNETAGLLDQVPRPRAIDHSLPASLQVFVWSTPDHLVYRSSRSRGLSVIASDLWIIRVDGF